MSTKQDPVGSRALGLWEGSLNGRRPGRARGLELWAQWLLPADPPEAKYTLLTDVETEA